MNSLVLFGAGASYGSGPVYPYSQPLGYQLFGELKAFSVITWGQLPAYIDKEFTKNFEIGMGLFVNSNEFSDKPADSSNLFNRFLTEIKKPLDCINYSTLNYDILFESAAAMTGLNVTHFEKIDGKLLFLKLHGSCNFLPNVNLTMTNVSFHGYRRFIAFPLKVASVDETLSFCNCSLMSPAMSIYTTDKIAQFGHDQIEEIQITWKKLVMNADRILLIGVRPWMEDRHVWEPLSNTNAVVAFVGGKNDFSNWVESNRNERETEYLGNIWSDCFEKTIQFMDY